MWLLIAANLLAPLNWVICLVVVGALWKLAHPVGVVMMSTVVSSMIGEGIGTRFQFNYESEDWFIAMALVNLCVFVVIGSILATTIWAVLRLRR